MKQLGFGKKKEASRKPSPPRSRSATDMSIQSTQQSQATDQSVRTSQQEMQSLATKIAFLENENKQLAQEKANLQETLTINKEVLNGMLAKTLTNEEDILGQLQEESDMLVGEIQRMQAERDELSSKVLVLEQINFELSRKQIEASETHDQEQA